MNPKDELVAAKSRLEELSAQRDALDVEIAKLKGRIAALSQLSDEEDAPTPNPVAFTGLTDACRTALQASKRPLSISGLKAMLDFFEFPTEQYVNPLANVQTTIRRMMDTGEVVTTELADGKTGYRWVAERSRARNKGRFQSRYKSKFSK